MSVDVSGKRFTVPREITASGNFLTVKFYVKDMPIPRSLYNRISWYSGTPNQLKYYREGDNTGVVVYNAGEWVSDAYYDIYSKITFATGTTLSDSEYEWLTSFAVEETLYLAEGDSMGKVANAIRDRSWAVGMYNFPDGFDAAIRAIGNYYTGGTVSWNQLIQNGVFPNGTTGWTLYRVTATVQSGEITLTIGSGYTAGSCFQDFDIVETHKYYISGYAKCGTGASAGIQVTNGVQKTLAITDQSYERVDTIGYARLGYSQARFQFRLTGTDGQTASFKCPQVIDLTTEFGSIIADYLYTLESDAPGAGVAKFHELFPDDYYPYQVTPVLTSFKPGEWPVNAGTELRGILTLDGEGWHRDADEYNNGVVLRKYAYPDMDNVGLDWRYNDTYDYYYTGDLYNSIGAMKIDDTSPISFITDAYPTGGMILSTQGPADMTDGYIYQKSRNTSIGQGIILYVKDTSITSDHLNTFMAKIAGKKLVIKTATSSYYNP